MLASSFVCIIKQKIFFNDNGSTAVEAGIKMALQYHHNKGEKRDTLIAFEDGFHGDTFGAMSASGLSSYNGPFEDFLLKVKRIPPPQEDTVEEVLAQLETIVQHHKCAAFIFEPLVQGAAGMKFHSSKGLDALIKKCQELDILCIADEIMLSVYISSQKLQIHCSNLESRCESLVYFDSKNRKLNIS